ncbi:uncharacterized protein LOC111385455 [Olea europaea var. sylvestris]|uniref:uncharacterized protein LOC111385455 n=1 Tax=Olea europaea var. sylvestris TaxID=158386 RepID=UPI000C1D1FB9|nr:uncharacterized protein LOC111385455 [Olea europaea var. sylvestris]
MAARKLRPYFLEHPIEVLTNSPLRQILQRPDTSGGMKETPWKLYVDGSSTRERSGVGVVLISPEHRIFCETLPFNFKASNNEAEYEALIAGARMASGLGISDLIIHCDSQLIVNQNGHIDALARLDTSEGIEEFDSILVGKISLPSTELAEAVLMMIDPKPTWQDKIIAYLKIGKCPESSTKARKLRIRSARYTLMYDVLYKQGYSTPLLKCLNEEAQHALQDIHEGICGNHSGGLSLAHKIMRQVPAPRSHHKYSTTRTEPSNNTLALCKMGDRPNWTYAHWKKRFGIPHSIVTDNGKQFDNAQISDFCEEFGIKKHFSTPNHPQANGQVEAINKIIKQTLKAKLDLFKGG